MDKGGCKVGKKSDKGGCKTGKKKMETKDKPKPKRKLIVRNPGKPIDMTPKKKAPTHVILGKEVPTNIKLVSLKEYRGGVKDDGKQFSDGGNLTPSEKRATQGNRGSFVLLDETSGKVYDNMTDYKKNKVSGETQIIKYKKPGGSRATKREGIKIGILEFVKTPRTGYNYSWIGNMYQSRNV